MINHPSLKDLGKDDLIIFSHVVLVVFLAVVQ